MLDELGSRQLGSDHLNRVVRATHSPPAPATAEHKCLRNSWKDPMRVEPGSLPQKLQNKPFFPFFECILSDICLGSLTGMRRFQPSNLRSRFHEGMFDVVKR